VLGGVSEDICWAETDFSEIGKDTLCSNRNRC
jgi:hypothetical protein